MSRQVTTTVYDFDELSDAAKAKAIDEYRQGMDYPWLTDDMANKLEELLEQHKITYDLRPTVYYSLNYCQGDGAMFEGTLHWRGHTVEVRQSGHYYHYNSKQFWNFTKDATGRDATDTMYNKFNDIYVSICQELEKYGYAEIEAATSDENISAYLSEMEYQFHADGSMYYER